MRRVTTLLTILAGLALVSFTYQQAVLEGTLGPAALLGAALLGGLVLAFALLTWLAGTRHRDLAGNVLLALASAAGCYLALDIGAGWILIGRHSPPLVPHPYRHHAMVPGSEAEISEPDFDFILHVNSLGLRGRETTLEKPAGTRRILMLGDSFTMGKGVQDAETFPVLVEQELQPLLARCGGGSLEVLNGGIDSYAPILSYLFLDRELARLAPDLVVLNLDNSDLIQETAYRQQAVREGGAIVAVVPQAGNDPLYERFFDWSSRHLFFTRSLLVLVNRAVPHRELTVRGAVNEVQRETFAHTLEGDIDRTTQWDGVFDSVGLVKRRSASIGADFLLVTYPWAHQLGPEGWVPGRYAFMKEGERTSDLTQRTIRERSAAMGVDLYEAMPAFLQHRGSEKLYFDNDPHWTPAGHRVMADGLARYIADHQLARWCPAP